MKNPNWPIKVKSLQQAQGVYLVAEGSGSYLQVLVAPYPDGMIIAVPNYGVAAPGADPTDFFYNARSLEENGLSPVDARTVAAAIAEVLKDDEEGERSK